MKHPNAPDPSPTCPRCNYWRLKASEDEDATPHRGAHPYPLGIDQHKALEILTAAFPNSYGGKR